MPENLLEECVRRELARSELVYGEPDDVQREQTVRYVAPIVADVLDMVATRVPVEPGPCWHDSGVTWPNGQRPRCDLRAGHAGAHEWDRGSAGGTAVWIETETMEVPR